MCQHKTSGPLLPVSSSEQDQGCCGMQRGRDAPRRVHSDDGDSESDDYYSYDTSKQLKTFRVNTMPPINEWVVVEDGVSFQRCAVHSLAVLLCEQLRGSAVQQIFACQRMPCKTSQPREALRQRKNSEAHRAAPVQLQPAC